MSLIFSDQKGIIDEMKHEYHEGKQVRDKFERTMTALFRAPKPAKKEPKPKLEKKD
jgi:hypothetical protein